jgi:C4-dicarboxylate-binding protein DctP
MLAAALAMAGCVQSNVGDKDSGSKDSPAGTSESGVGSGSNTPGPDATDEQINAFITEKSSNPDKIALRYATTSPDLNGQSYLRGCREFLRAIKEEMGDKVEISYILNGQAGGTADAVLGGLQNGSFELSDWPLASFAEYTNAFQPLDTPYLVTSADQMRELYQSEAGNIMKEKCISDSGIIPFYYGQIGMRQITNSKNAIKTPDDLAGIKLRVQNNELHIAGMKALGAQPTSIPFSELFTALQQKTVDGQENPLETIYNFQYYDVQNYLTISNHIAAVGTVCASKKFYDGADAELKAAIDKAAVAAESYTMADLEKSFEEIKKALADTGKIEIYEPTAEELAKFQEEAKGAWPEIKKVVGEEYFDKVVGAAGLA